MDNVATSAITRAWELGMRLRERREQLGLTVAAAGKTTGIGPNNLSAIENGRRKLTPAKLADLISLFAIEDTEAEELRALRATADQRDWHHRYASLLSDDVTRYIGLEMGAEHARMYDNSFVPGLLQTADYARATIRGGSPYIRLTEVDPLTEVRLIRQQRLSGDDPLRLTVLLGEAVLHLEVGGPEVMRQQLDHLVKIMREWEHVDLRVIPYKAGAHPAHGGMFTILSFASPFLLDVVWQETLTSFAIVDRTPEVREFSMAFAEAMERALSVADSIDLIRRIAKEMT